MDIIIDKRFSAMYCLKFVRFMGSWMCSTVTRKFFSDDYFHVKILSNNATVKRLTSMVWTWAKIQLVFEIAMLAIVYLLGNIKDEDSDESVLLPAFHDPDFLISYVVDTVLTFLLTFVIALISASVIGNRTRFDYVTQGLRAARSMEEIIVNASAVSFLVPFFLIV